MDFSLYQLNSMISNVIEGGFIFDEETGEILFDSENLDELKESYENKLNNCGCFIKNLDAQINALKAEEEAMKKRRIALENKRKRLSEYILNNMHNLPSKKLTTAQNDISVRRSKVVEIVDSDLIPGEFLRMRTEVKPDKTKIKKAIDDGRIVPGAAVVVNENLSIK